MLKNVEPDWLLLSLQVLQPVDCACSLAVTFVQNSFSVGSETHETVSFLLCAVNCRMNWNLHFALVCTKLVNLLFHPCPVFVSCGMAKSEKFHARLSLEVCSSVISWGWSSFALCCCFFLCGSCTLQFSHPFLYKSCLIIARVWSFWMFCHFHHVLCLLMIIVGGNCVVFPHHHHHRVLGHFVFPFWTVNLTNKGYNHFNVRFMLCVDRVEFTLLLSRNSQSVSFCNTTRNWRVVVYVCYGGRDNTTWDCDFG